MRSTGTTSQHSRLTRNSNKCQFVVGEPGEGSETLLVVNERNSEHYTDEFSVRPGSGVEKLWVIVRESGARGVRLIEGDVLKLGRVMFRVKQLSLQGEGRPTFPSLLTSVKVEVYSPEPDTPLLTCRICLSDTQTLSNPLISPCHCSGTMKFIHLECLQEWLKSRLNLKQNGSAMSYFWRTLDCELCKEDFPTAIQINDEARDLVEVHKPNCAFIVLEDIRRENSNRGLHVVSLSEGNCFKLGRGHECDIRVSDISVSRMHAIVKLSQGGFYLEDKNSKFGTLVQAKRTVTLATGVVLALQVNRTTVTLKVKRPWKLLQCCQCFHRPSQALTDRSSNEKPNTNDDRESSAEDRQSTPHRDFGEPFFPQMTELPQLRESLEPVQAPGDPPAPHEEEKCEMEGPFSPRSS